MHPYIKFLCLHSLLLKCYWGSFWHLQILLNLCVRPSIKWTKESVYVMEKKMSKFLQKLGKTRISCVNRTLNYFLIKHYKNTKILYKDASKSWVSRTETCYKLLQEKERSQKVCLKMSLYVNQPLVKINSVCFINWSKQKKKKKKEQNE